MCVCIVMDLGAYNAGLWIAGRREGIHYVVTPADDCSGRFGGAVVENAGNLCRVNFSL